MREEHADTHFLRNLIIGSLVVSLYCLTVAFGPQLLMASAAEVHLHEVPEISAQLIADASCAGHQVSNESLAGTFA